MIPLGAMTVTDQESLAAARGKVLGLVRALSGDEVLATRAATAVSHAVRAGLSAAAGGVDLALQLDTRQPPARLVLHLRAGPSASDPRLLTHVFDRVRPLAPADGAAEPPALVAELPLAALTLPLNARLLDQERARLATRSRAELMDELRIKNRQLEEYSRGLEETVAQRTAELREANQQMQHDLQAGADYVRALIPAPMSGPIRVDWRYVPSSNLGGDTIGYHHLDDRRLAIYLIDVTGHGLDSALLAVTITNVIRTGTLAGADMKRPDQVVAALNQAFQGEQHGQKYFTIWYGVYDTASGDLTWSAGGHHPAVLLHPDLPDPVLLPASGPIVGCVPDLEFPAETRRVRPGSQLLLFSDGLFEIIRNGELVWTLDGAIDFLARHRRERGPLMDVLIARARELRGAEPGARLDDDLSIIEVAFD